MRDEYHWESGNIGEYWVSIDCDPNEIQVTALDGDWPLWETVSYPTDAKLEDIRQSVWHRIREHMRTQLAEVEKFDATKELS